MSKRGEMKKSLSIENDKSKQNEKTEILFQSLTSLVSDTPKSLSPSQTPTPVKLNPSIKRQTIKSTFQSIRSKATKHFNTNNNTNINKSADKIIMNQDENLSSKSTKSSSSSKSPSPTKTSKVKKGTSNLVRKFQNLKKHKINPKRDNTPPESSSSASLSSKSKSKNDEEISTASSGSLKRRTPEGGNLNLSQVSLNIDEKNKNSNNEQNKKQVNIFKVSSSNIQLPVEPISTSTTSLSSSDQITISSSKSISETLNNNKKKLSSELIGDLNETNVKFSDETPKFEAPSVPYKISKDEVKTLIKSSSTAPLKKLITSPIPSKKIIDPTLKSTVLKSPTSSSSTGTIRKTLNTQKSREDFFQPLKPVKNIEILKIVETDDFLINEKNLEKGNNLKNPNLSNFTKNAEEINFQIGKSVRPPKIIEFRTSSIDEKSLDINDFDQSLVLKENLPDLPEGESFTSFASGSSSRRRISVEPDITATNPIITAKFSNESREISSYLSDFSLDSDFNSGNLLDMPPHGDLISSDQTTNMTTSQSPSSSGTIGGSGGISNGSQEKREYLYKILVIGELGTGKTSFIRRYVHNFFSQNYRATIGVDFALKVLNWDQKSIIRLQLWDIAGQERFGNMTRVYYKEAAGAFIVFDVTRSATFDAVVKWKQDLDSKVQLPDGSPIPCILLANKCDQPKQGSANNPSKLDEYVKENGFAGWFETSAKDNINIEDAAKALVNKILQNDKMINAGVVIDNDKIALDGQSDQQQKKNCISC